MAMYNYKAVNLDGRKVAGQLNANNDLDLYQRLREVELELVSFRELKNARARAILAARVKGRDLIQMCVHLQQLIGAGVNLIEGLADVRDATEQRRLRDLLTEVHQDVSQGRSLSEAFGRHPKVFGQVFQSLIAAGEESGNLTESFIQLVKHLRWTEEVNSKIKKATRYPAFMVLVIIALFGFMMTMVVPEVVGFLKGNGQTLPGVTLALIATSDFIINYWPVLIVTPAALFFLIRLGAHLSEDFAYQVDYYMLRMPVAGSLMRKISLSRFAHFFATMFRSGVPILQCLDTAQKVVSNICLGKSLARVRAGVQDGNPLSLGLKESGEFPSLVIRMVKIGEDSGNLGETLENVTTFYDEDVNEAVDAMVAMIEPALTVFAGLMMAWIVVAVIGPIYDSFSKMG